MTSLELEVEKSEAEYKSNIEVLNEFVDLIRD